MFRNTIVALSFVSIVASSLALGRAVDTYTPTKKADEVWIAFAIGSSSIRKGYGKVSIFSAISKTRNQAQWEALDECADNAYACLDLPSISTKQICRFVVAGYIYSGYYYVYGTEPNMLESECISRLGHWTCSTAVGHCQ